MKGNEHGFPGETLLFIADRQSIPSYLEDVGQIKCFFSEGLSKIGPLWHIRGSLLTCNV